MDRLESMSLLLSVIEAGSLSAASRKLRIPLPSVSRKISELESHLGVQLLIRTTRSLELTESGRAYAGECARILEDIEEMEKKATGEYNAPKGSLFITAPIVFGRLFILPTLTDFLKVYPDIDAQLKLTDRMVDIVDERVDLAIRIGELEDSSMLSARIGIVREAICASPTYLKSRGTPKTPKELAGHDCVSIESIGSSTAWDFPTSRGYTSVPIHSRLTVSHVEAGLDAAVAGIGITRALSYQVDILEKSGKLKSILKDFVPQGWPVQMIHRGGRNIPLKLRAFLDFSLPRLRAKLPQ
jgi:DNA-binding transcriptional LysR family regulator